MRSTLGWFLVCLTACTNAGAPRDPEPAPEQPPTATPGTPPAPTPETPPETPPETTSPTPAAAVTVQMTSATLADACGGPQNQAAGKSKMKRDMKMSRSCDQSSMQLSVAVPAGAAATRLGVKKVELLDDKGATLGELTAGTPMMWDQDGTYQPWDENAAPGRELSVSYTLSQPPWGTVSDRWNRTYVLRAAITVGSGEQAVQRDVYVAAPTTLPPNVKT